MSEWVMVESYSNRQLADLAASLLTSQGVENRVKADDEGSLNPALAFTLRVKVLVHERDLPKARDLLQEQAIHLVPNEEDN